MDRAANQVLLSAATKTTTNTKQCLGRPTTGARLRGCVKSAPKTSSRDRQLNQHLNEQDQASSCDLKTKIQLLQSKLHPQSFSHNNKPSFAQDSLLDSGRNTNLPAHRYLSDKRPMSRQSDRSDSPPNSSATDERQSSAGSPIDDEADSLSLSSGASDGSSTDRSSLAPTPPPRFSSLLADKQRLPAESLSSQPNRCAPGQTGARPGALAEQACGRYSNMLAAAPSSGLVSGFKAPGNALSANGSSSGRGGGSSLPAAGEASGDNECVPLVTHATLSQQQQQQQHQQQQQNATGHLREFAKLAGANSLENLPADCQALGVSCNMIIGQRQRQLYPHQFSQKPPQRNNPLMGSQSLLPVQAPLATSANSEPQPPFGGVLSNNVRHCQPEHLAGSYSSQATHPLPPSPHANQSKQVTAAAAAATVPQQQQNLSNLSANPKTTTINCFLAGQNKLTQQRNNYSQQVTSCYANNNAAANYQRQQQQQVLAAGQQGLQASNWPASPSKEPAQHHLLRSPEAFNFGYSRAPITKAVQDMVNLKQQQQQQQATFVINTPSSRHPIRGCALPPVPSGCPAASARLQQSNGLPDVVSARPNQPINFSNNSASDHLRPGWRSFGSVSSASSITSISSLANSPQQSLPALANRPPSQSISSGACPKLAHQYRHDYPVAQLAASQIKQHTKDSLEQRQHEQLADREHCHQANCVRRLEEAAGSNKIHCLRLLRRRLLNQPARDCEVNAALVAVEIEGKLETIVNEDGNHSLVSAGCDYIELNGSAMSDCSYDDESTCAPLLPVNELVQSNSQLRHENNDDDEELDYDEQVAAAAGNNGGLFSLGATSGSYCHFCETCLSRSVSLASGLPASQLQQVSASPTSWLANAEAQVARWNGPRTVVNMAAASECPELYANGAGQDDDQEELTLWPIVELHENPLNPSSANQKPAELAGSVPADELQWAATLLERSRLLSLQESQREKRAAIRMISPDSVQLLVSANNTNSNSNTICQPRNCSQRDESTGKRLQDGRSENLLGRKTNDLLMMKDPGNQVAEANCEHSSGLVAESSGKRQQQANEQTRARRQLEGGQEDVSEGHFARAFKAADGGKENNDIAPANQEQQTKQNGSGAPDNTCLPGERCAEMIAGEVETTTRTPSGQTICATPSNQQRLRPNESQSNGSAEAELRNGQVNDEPSRSGETKRDSEERKSIVRESASASKTPLPARDERGKAVGALRDELGESPEHVDQRRCVTESPGHDEAGCLEPARKVSSLASSSSCCLPSGSPNESSSSPASSPSFGSDSSSRWLRQQQLEPQFKQRQASEMLQLMRLRQQRAAAAINSTTTSTSRSHEMPTLQQLQQQMQANRAIQQQQPPSGSTCVSPQQERRMQQQWTAPAMLQQQQQRKHGEPSAEDRPGNGAAAATTTIRPTCKTLNMELEQQQQQQKVLLQTTTTTTTTTTTSAAPNTSEPLSPRMPNSAEATKSPSPNIVCDIEASQPLANYLNRQNERCQNSIVADPGQRVANGGSGGPSGRICQPADGQRECSPAGDGAQGSSSLLTTADSRTRRPIGVDMANSTDDIQTGRPTSPSPNGAPVPSPRAVQQQNQNQQTQSKHPIQTELSILTNTNCLMLNPRLRDLSNGCNSIQSSAQSTPSHSILSDSTTLITEAAMNSSELIPKLIERLDRKLIVMKEEQLTLKREMELNEATGQRLFESMKQHLTVNEYEKISMHAKEIEKVTKLILSLKMRLKRVEAELKERNAKNERQQLNQRYHEDTDKSNVNSNDTSSQSDWAQDRLPTISGSCNQQGDSHPTSASYLPKQPLPTVRGVSDPTSATGLPKRNHQHHASLQTDSANQSQQELMMNRANQPALVGDPVDVNGPCNGFARSAANPSRHHHNHHHHHQVSLTNSSCDSNSSRICSPKAHHELANSSNHRTGCSAEGAIKKIISTIAEQDGSKAASTSSDSIFNYADSAIGSTIMGHGGSVTNIEQPAISQSSLSSVSSDSSAHSSSTRQSSSSHHQLHSNSPSQSHLSSSISVSSHSSLSSPPLVSPASTTCLGSASPSSVSTAIGEGGQAFSNNAASHLMMKTTVAGASSSPGFHPRGSNVSCTSSQPESEANGSSLNSTRLSAFFADSSLSCSVSDNNNNSSLANDLLQEPLARPRGILTADSTDPKLLQQTDLDILVAKQTKLISQLEEAHQLEECIVHRNNIIIQRILKKYFDDTCPDGEIEEFRQFTRLKSLLLKDTHDIGDKIVSVELQLNELKQNNPCNA